MPSLHNPGPVKISFYSQDCSEPIHVHVKVQGKVAKFWMDPIEVADPGRFKAHELNMIRKVLKKYKADIEELWDEHCCKD